MNSPSLLLFDLGGVLIESSVFENLSDLLPDSPYLTAIKDQWLFSPSVIRFERGEMSSCEFAESFIAEWGLQITPQVFIKEFTSWPRELFPGARETIHLLRKNYRVGCLSNSNSLHWERFRGLEDDFDCTLLSHMLGVTKPDPEIFRFALRECDVDPAKIYFFDDCLTNVEAAQSFGITAFHVDGFEALQDVLICQGLLPIQPS